MQYFFKQRALGYTLTLLLVVILSQSCMKRCIKYPIYSQCRIRMKHAHGGQIYRGVPFYKKQNMQYGEKHKGGKDSPYITPPTKKPIFKRKQKVVPKPHKKDGN